MNYVTYIGPEGINSCGHQDRYPLPGDPLKFKDPDIPSIQTGRITQINEHSVSFVVGPKSIVWQSPGTTTHKGGTVYQTKKPAALVLHSSKNTIAQFWGFTKPEKTVDSAVCHNIHVPVWSFDGCSDSMAASCDKMPFDEYLKCIVHLLRNSPNNRTGNIIEKCLRSLLSSYSTNSDSLQGLERAITDIEASSGECFDKFLEYGQSISYHESESFFDEFRTAYSAFKHGVPPNQYFVNALIGSQECRGKHNAPHTTVLQ